MPGKVRRIVTGVNAAGRSYIVSDTLLPKAAVAPGAPVRAGLWTTDAAPSSNKGTHDPVPDGVVLYTPPAHRGGSVIRVTDIVPDKQHAYDPEELRRRNCKITPDRSAKHPAGAGNACAQAKHHGKKVGDGYSDRARHLPIVDASADHGAEARPIQQKI